MATGYEGTYRATVVDDGDPSEQRRLHIVVPGVYGDASVWAAASLRASAASAQPGIGDEVWVSFEHGDTDYPVWERAAAPDHGAVATAPYIGKYRGIVVNNDDPLQQGRVEVTVDDVEVSPTWAVPDMNDAANAAPPAVGAEVWVEYDDGDGAHPRWVGLA